MARRKPPAPPGTDDRVPILPRHLIAKGLNLSAAEYAELCGEQRAWFRSHGIDPGRWSQVYPVLLASWSAHGIESALERARRRAQGNDRGEMRSKGLS